MDEWMDRELNLGTLHVCSIPPPFAGFREPYFSSQEQIDFLAVEIQYLLEKQAFSLVSTHDSERGSTLHTYWFTRKWEISDPSLTSVL